MNSTVYKLIHAWRLPLAPLLVLLAWAAQATSTTLQDDVTTAAEQFLQSLYSDTPATRLDIQVDQPDARLNLTNCTQPLQVELRNGRKRLGRQTLAISCSDADGWSIYVAATVRAFDQVVVAATALPRGGVISASQVSLEEQDVTFLHQGYFRDLEPVLGATVNRPLSGGRIITPAQISPPRIVNRGERVAIVASNPALSIRAPGVALTDGALGELIQVRNSSSNRVIEGRVSGPGTVSVNF